MKEGHLKWGLPVFSFARKVGKCQRGSVDDIGSGEDGDDDGYGDGEGEGDGDGDGDGNSALRPPEIIMKS